MKLIFLGAPGAGKGTQASRTSTEYGIPHISTGDILRKNIKDNTELGVKAKSFIDAGQLVPDEVVIGIVEKRIKEKDCVNGFILDGFPRTVPQAIALAKFVDIDAVIDIHVPYSLIIDRISGRRVCACGESHHVSWGASETTCAKCGGKLYQRDDDKEETVRARIEVYDKQTAPLIKFYSELGKIVTVDGSLTPSEVFELIAKVIDDYNKK